MPSTNPDVAPGSEIDLAIERALSAADLRAGDGATTASVLEVEPSAAEASDGAGVFDADGD